MRASLYRLPPAPPVFGEEDVSSLISNSNRNFTDTGVVKRGNWQSGNFVSGSSGWQIDAEGNAEFNSGTFRGNFQIGGTLITVSDIADLQTSIDSLTSLGGGTVALVPGDYVATSGFTIPSGVTLDGNGASIDFNGAAYQVLIQGTDAYSTGTLAVNYGSTSLVGTGTTWTAGMVGRSILIGDYWYQITARTDNTHLTIGSKYIGTNITGASYVIATTVDGVGLSNITLTNSSTTLLKYRYVNGLNMEGVVLLDSPQGLDGHDSANVNFILGSTIDNCTAGMTADNNPFMIIDGILVSNITGGTGIALTGVTNTSMGSISLQGITGVGLKYTNCYNLGFVNYSVIECTSHGIEFVSGNSAIDLISGYTDTVGGDGIKLTATSDNIDITAQTLANTTGYGINIAASSCDNNRIGSIGYSNCTAGNLNDAGTGTIRSTTPTVTTFIPQTVMPSVLGTLAVNVNTTMQVGLFFIPANLTVTSITIVAGTVNTAGTYDLTVYSEDGQTRHIAVTTASVTTADTEYTTAVASVNLSPGNYYFAINPNGTADAIMRSRALNAVPVFNTPTGKAVMGGTVTITAGTPPTTITPSSITSAATAPYFRFN